MSDNGRHKPEVLGADLGATALISKRKQSSNQIDTRLVRLYPSPPNKETPLHGAFFVWRRCVVEAPKVVQPSTTKSCDRRTNEVSAPRRGECRRHESIPPDVLCVPEKRIGCANHRAAFAIWGQLWGHTSLTYIRHWRRLSA